MQESFLQQLNPSQQKAVKTTEGALLILAGAGSGKTKTITTRLAYLIDEVGVPPSDTLTLTFTNKAAAEMQKRALDMIENATSHPPLLCTFHKFGLLFLKFHIHHLERKNNFTLIDREDTKKILKGFNNELFPMPLLLSEISRYKNSQISPQEAIQNAYNPNYKEIAKIYLNYQNFLLQNNRIDFDDLLLLPLEIFKKSPETAKEMSQKYQYIMVDEYQDTNELQYLLLKHLCSTHQNICVVGDDDQSIYSWRGANIQNILNFTQHFNNAQMIKLEENYRSSKKILEAANNLISKNKERLGKNLKSTLEEGKDVVILHTYDELEEVKNLCKIIKKLLAQGVETQNIAILFRLNALSRSLEEGFNREKIPYTLVGTIRFYERSEIKDILSYFQILINIHDDFSLMRIINKPRRGIGKTTIDKLKSLAESKNYSIYQLYKEDTTLEKLLGKKTLTNLKDFFDTLELLQKCLKDSPQDFLDTFESQIGFCESFNKSNEEVERVGNIQEFYGIYREYYKHNPLMELEDFLNDLALRSDQEDVEMRQQGVKGINCMSVHSSKGLEFDYVFIIGLEEGFFPMIKEDSILEEERRLGYVAFTRAKKELYLSYVDSRFYKGNRANISPSRFLEECGAMQPKPTKYTLNSPENDNNFKKGDCIFHKIFGAGRILEVTKSGKETKLQINFGGLIRNILSDYVKKI